MSQARRRAAILMAALFLAGAVSALTSVVPDRASAGARLAYGNTSRWYWMWETHPFAVSGPGVVDIWTICRPKFSAITQHELLVGTSDASWLRRIRVRQAGALGPPRRHTPQHVAHGGRPRHVQQRGLLLYGVRHGLDERVLGPLTEGQASPQRVNATTISRWNARMCSFISSRARGPSRVSSAWIMSRWSCTAVQSPGTRSSTRCQMRRESAK
jgi:hypothetical protein